MLVSYCHVTNPPPQKKPLKTTNIYYLMFSVVRNLVSLAEGLSPDSKQGAGQSCRHLSQVGEDPFWRPWASLWAARASLAGCRRDISPQSVGGPHHQAAPSVASL